LLRQMAAGVIDRGKHGEIIVYCGVGGYASSWWFVLTQMLGYTGVKIYDGAAEAWAKDNDMISYSWIS
ncbi:MAG: rhodanese-like domain-containing protein, partial [bacterium]